PDQGICGRFDHRDIPRVLMHDEDASTIRNDGEFLWSRIQGRDRGFYNLMHCVDDGNCLVTIVANIGFQAVWGHGEPNRTYTNGNYSRHLVGSGIDYRNGI